MYCAQTFRLFRFPKTYLLAEAQNLEALEVGEVLAALRAVGALSERALGPLAVNLVLSPELLNGTGTGSTGKLGDGEVGEGGVGESENVTGHDLVLLGRGTVNEDLQEKNRKSIHKFPLNLSKIPIFQVYFAISDDRAIPHTRRWSTISTIAASLPS